MRLVIVDDQQMLVEAMDHALSELGHEVLAVGGPGLEAAVATVGATEPDVCLLDAGGADPERMAAIGDFRAASPGTRVVVMSDRLEPATVARALVEGAAGFVSKEQSIGEVVDVLGRAHEGQVAVDPDMLRGALGAGHERGRSLWQLEFLTDREWEVLRCLVDGLSTEDMASVLGVRRSTARTHVQNLLTKLGVHSRLKAAALVTAHVAPHAWPPHVRSRGPVEEPAAAS